MGPTLFLPVYAVFSTGSQHWFSVVIQNNIMQSLLKFKVLILTSVPTRAFFDLIPKCKYRDFLSCCAHPWLVEHQTPGLLILPQMQMLALCLVCPPPRPPCSVLLLFFLRFIYLEVRVTKRKRPGERRTEERIFVSQFILISSNTKAEPG